MFGVEFVRDILVVTVSIGILLFGVILAIYSLAQYNSIRRLRNAVEQERSDVWVQLKRRRDLIDNLVAVVSTYAVHERITIGTAVQLRAQAQAPGGQQARALAEGQAVDVRGLLALAERYPNLTASGNFQQLTQDVVETETLIANARESLNLAARQYNDARSTFPNVVLLGWLFRAQEYFEFTPELSRPIVIHMDKALGGPP